MTETSPNSPEPLSDHARSTSHVRMRIVIILIIAFALIILAIYTSTQTRTVTLAIDGTAQSLQTQAFTVRALLNEENIVLSPADRITPPVDTLLRDGQLIRIDRAHRISLQVEDVVIITDIAGNSAAEILANAGIEVQNDARVFVNGEEVDRAYLAENSHETISRIVILHPRPFSVVITPAFASENTERLSLRSSALSVGAALYEAGIELYLADHITPELSTPLYPGLEINIQRAQPIIITADGTNLTTRVLGGTVADALSAANIALMGQDYALPDLNAPITANTAIRVIRVKENLLTEILPIPFETIYQEDPDLAAGSRQIIQEGRDGVEQIVTRIRLEDGEETERTIIRRTVLVASQEQIIASAP